MKNNPTLWFYEKLKSDGQCLLYNGIFSDHITGEILKLYESDIESHNESLIIKKRVVFLMAECFQNIIRHGSQSEEYQFNTLENGFFLAWNYAGKYYLVSGNSIANKNVDSFRDKLEQLNMHDKEGLDALHKKILIEGKLSSKGGAGLGLIEMARKSGHKLLFSFEKLNNDYSLFYNQVILKSEVVTSIPDKNIRLEFAYELHKKMVDETILMLQKGDFSKKTILPNLKIIQNNINNDQYGSGFRQEVYHIFVELLLNISNHCYSENELKPGIFSISKKDGKYEISVGNLMEKNNVGPLKEHLDTLNKLNKDELKELYVHKLKNVMEQKEGDFGMGLINVARLQTEKMKYSFEDYANNLVFFTINIMI
jgi:hypothetical protein